MTNRRSILDHSRSRTTGISRRPTSAHEFHRRSEVITAGRPASGWLGVSPGCRYEHLRASVAPTCGVDRRAARSAAVRRGRILLGLLAIGVLSLLVVPMATSGVSPSASATGASIPVANSPYVVQVGDTMWSIAQRLQPGGDPRPLVAKMAQEVGSYNLYPGEQLKLP